MKRPRRDIIKLLQSLYKIDQVFHKDKGTSDRKKRERCIDRSEVMIRETVPDIEIRLASYTSKVPNHVVLGRQATR